jgi:putative protease
MRNCPVAAANGGCKVCSGFAALTDRKGNNFFVNCGDGVPALYNGVPLYLGDRLDEISGVDFLTLYFTMEEPWECDEILSLYRTGKGVTWNITRGLYYRKVL